MKLKYKYVLMLLMASVWSAMIVSCSEDEGGKPFVNYIRVTNPEASDSLLVAAGQGKKIAIMGRNLQNTVEIWFNDQQAQLVPTFITSSSIIVPVPSDIPDVVTDQMKLKFSNGDSLMYDFSVDINEPRIDRMLSEYVEEGDEATFYGDFFYAPVSVVFSGGVEAEVLSVEDEAVTVKVPAGAQIGPVTITSNFGATESDLWFRDNRNIIASHDVPLTSGVWQGPSRIVASDPNIPNVNGKFIRINANLGAWPFYEMYGGPKEGDIGEEAGKIPPAALLNPRAFSLKFEINTLASLTGATMRLHLGNATNGQLDAARQSSYYVWSVNLDTHGKWQTVTIPFEDVFKGFTYDADGYSMFIYWHGPNPTMHNLGMDNMRVVPNINE